MCNANSSSNPHTFNNFRLSFLSSRISLSFLHSPIPPPLLLFYGGLTVLGAFMHVYTFLKPVQLCNFYLKNNSETRSVLHSAKTDRPFKINDFGRRDPVNAHCAHVRRSCGVLRCSAVTQYARSKTIRCFAAGLAAVRLAQTFRYKTVAHKWFLCGKWVKCSCDNWPT